jgi:hypothetical protein
MAVRRETQKRQWEKGFILQLYIYNWVTVQISPLVLFLYVYSRLIFQLYIWGRATVQTSPHVFLYLFTVNLASVRYINYSTIVHILPVLYVYSKFILYLYLCGKAAFEIGPNVSYLGRGLSRDLHCDICDTAIVETPVHVYIFLYFF